MTTTAFAADLAETRYAEDPGGRFAYRRLGPRSPVPLVMATRFRGTIDHWDPALLVLRDLIQPWPTFSSIYADALKALQGSIAAARQPAGAGSP